MSTTTPVDVEALRLYVDAIDCKPQNFDWSSNPREDFADEYEPSGVPWSFTEYREPEDGDEANCAECGTGIIYVNDVYGWHHQSALNFDLADNEAEAFEAGEEEYDHDPEPDTEYTQDPEYCEGPMMNYWYPVEIRDVESAAKKLAGLPVCVVTVDGDTGLALTGGGMDLSWEICEAFIAIGSYPPFHFVSQLPKMAMEWTDRHELVLAAGRKVCQIVADWAQTAAVRLEDTATWTKTKGGL